MPTAIPFVQFADWFAQAADAGVSRARGRGGRHRDAGWRSVGADGAGQAGRHVGLRVLHQLRQPQGPRARRQPARRPAVSLGAAGTSGPGRRDRCSRVSADETAAYVRTRGRGSQLSALASPQSRRDRQPGRPGAADRGPPARSDTPSSPTSGAPSELPLPENWGGCRLRPKRSEFWQQRGSTELSAGSRHALHARHRSGRWLVAAARALGSDAVENAVYLKRPAADAVAGPDPAVRDRVSEMLLRDRARRRRRGPALLARAGRLGPAELRGRRGGRSPPPAASLSPELTREHRVRPGADPRLRRAPARHADRLRGRDAARRVPRPAPGPGRLGGRLLPERPGADAGRAVHDRARAQGRRAWRR